MRLESEVQPEDVAEALRLFKVSTMAANAADRSAAASATASAAAGVAGDTGGPSILSATAPSREEMLRTEQLLTSRLKVGTVVNKQRIVEEAAAQGYNAMVFARVIAVMVMRGEVQERNKVTIK